MLENGNSLIFTTKLEKSKNEKLICESFLHASFFISSNCNISHHSYTVCRVWGNPLLFLVKMGWNECLSYWAMHLVTSCGSKLFLFSEPLVYLTCFSCRSVVQLVASWIKCSSSSVLVNKNTSEMFHNQLPHGVSESWHIRIFPFKTKCLLPYCLNKTSPVWNVSFQFYMMQIIFHISKMC